MFLHAIVTDSHCSGCVVAVGVAVFFVVVVGGGGGWWHWW